jgi:hypothetical protein
MTEQLLEGLAVDARADLPVLALNDLRVVHTPAALGVAPRIDIVHRDQPGEPLISLDPADASTLAGLLAEQLACAWVHADEQRERIETLHEASAIGGVS